MAWLQTSFTSNPVGDGNMSNHRKGYKVGCNDKDPDHSDSPLLQNSPPDSPQSPEPNLFNHGSTAPLKKQGILQFISCKAGFLSSVFDKKPVTSAQKILERSVVTPSNVDGKDKNVSSKLTLCEFLSTQNVDDYESDVDDDMAESHVPGGYKRVRPDEE